MLFISVALAALFFIWDVHGIGTIALPHPSNIKPAIGSPAAFNGKFNLSHRRRLQSNSTQLACDSIVDCFNGYGLCVDGYCMAFQPDLRTDHVLRCVEGFSCVINAADLVTVGMNPNFRIRIVDPQYNCGVGPALEKGFFIKSEWPCDPNIKSGCSVSLGVGFRLNKANPVEAVRICGCPNADVGGDGFACNQNADFFSPVGILTMQECLTNAHCSGKLFAYCTGEKCAGYKDVSSVTGYKLIECLTSTSCTFSSVASKYITEGFKVLKLSNSLSCGADNALDPNYIQDNALPCVFDVDNDGNCDVNLGLHAVAGSSRLCGCSGADLGGDGIACNEAADFSEDIGLLNLGECIVESDCQLGYICFAGSCVADVWPPYVERMSPQHGTYTVQPVSSILLEFNENVYLNNVTGKVEIYSLTDPKVKFTFVIAKSTKNQLIELSQYYLRLTPDIRTSAASGLPEGTYQVILDEGLLKDKQGVTNPMQGLVFYVSNNVGCPYMYATGFYPGTGTYTNPNGRYRSISPLNGKAAWIGDDPTSNVKFYLYFIIAKNGDNHNGIWVIDVDTDSASVYAFSDPEKTVYSNDKQRPFSGSWSIVAGNVWQEMPVFFQCATVQDMTAPILTEIQPPIGGVDHPIDAPITLTFNENIFYGEKGILTISSTTTNHSIQMSPSSVSGMRGKYITSTGDTKTVILPSEPLKFGESYTISATPGFLVDTRNNLWGLVDPGILNFRVYGISCPEYQHPGLNFTVSGTGNAHGSQRQILCNRGLSPFSKFKEPYIVNCTNGIWDDLPMRCFQDCSPFDPLGSPYIVQVNSSYHDAEAIIMCNTGYSVLQGTQPESVRCIAGLWDSNKLRCARDCGSHPDLGSNYLVSGTGITTGSTRVIYCGNGSQPIKSIQPEIISCEDGSWQPPILECRRLCVSFVAPDNNMVVLGSGFIHGSTRNVTCAQGYVQKESEKASSIPFNIFTCVDGSWMGKSASCSKSCPTLSPGAGYDLSGDVGLTFEGATIVMKCRDGASVGGTIAQETLTCMNGSWSISALQCKARCSTPSVFFNKAYSFEPGTLTDPQMLHGAIGALTCAAGSTHLTGALKEMVVCNDGKWLTATGASTSLQCKMSCPQLVLSPGFSLIGSLASAHGSSAVVHCSDDYVPLSAAATESKIVCNDGKWELSVIGFTCNAPCSAAELQATLNIAVYSDFMQPLSSFGKGFVIPHGTKVPISCGPNSITHTKYPTSSVTLCDNGVWTYPQILCLLPGCHDGIMNLGETGVDCGDASLSCSACSTCQDEVQNGDETGIDCGGSCKKRCAPTCIDRVQNGDEKAIDCGGSCYNSANCPTTCGDGIQNGDETGVDCGGSCRSCATCLVFQPAHGVHVIPELGVNLTFPTHNTELTLRCAPFYFPPQPPGFEAGVTLLKQSKAICRDGSWTGGDFACERALCTDGERNGDETGIDCGGSCTDSCSSCGDGFMNGDEIGVDCGGSCPSACLRCSLLPIKAIMADNAFVVTRGDNFIGDRFGAAWKISCNPQVSSTQNSVDYSCLNGKWYPLLNITCPRDKDVALNGDDLDIDITPITQIPSSTLANNSTECDLDPVGSRQGNSCCSMRSEFLYALSSNNCYSLIVSGDAKMISSFCTGECFSNIASVVGRYSSRSGLGCSDIISFQDIISSFCAVDSGNVPCFADFPQHRPLFDLKVIASAAPSILNSFCEPLSCFRSNLKYMNALIQLGKRKIFTDNSDKILPVLKSLINQVTGYDSRDIAQKALATRQNRRLDHNEIFQDDWDDENAVLWNTLLHDDALFSEDKLLSSLLHQLHIIDESPETSSLKAQFAKHAESKHRRRLLTKSTSLASGLDGANTSEPLLRGPHPTLLVPSLMRTMCLKISGESCSKYVLDLALGKSDPLSMQWLKKSTTCPTSQQSASNGCSSAVIQSLGQALVENGSVYGFVMGSMMKLYGQYGCSFNSMGQTCGDVIFHSSHLSDALKLSEGPSPRTRKFIFDDEATLAPQCKTATNGACEISFIGDGDCDDSCFHPACAFDGGDCSPSAMFPVTFKAAMDALAMKSFKDTCNPLAAQLDCSNASSACKTKLTAALTSVGCCVTPAIELIRLLGDYHARLVALNNELLALQRTEPSPSGKSLIAASTANIKYISDVGSVRSIKYIEQSCGVSIDPACSSGSAHFNLRVGTSMSGIDYSALAVSSSGQSLLDAIAWRLQSKIANEAGFTPSSVSRVSFWQGSLVIESSFDSMNALSLATASAILEDVYATNGWATAVKSSIVTVPGISSFFAYSEDQLASKVKVQSNFNYIASSITTSQVVSTASSAPPPTLGTLGMAELRATLLPSDCPSDLPVTLGMGDSTVTQVYTVTDSSGRINSGSVADGAIRKISCKEGYDAVYPTVSPQDVTCSNGRWAPPAGQNLLVCRQSCKAPPSVSTLGLVIVSGWPNSDSPQVPDGSILKLKCTDDTGYSNVMGGVGTVTCSNGRWIDIRMRCSRSCDPSLVGRVGALREFKVSTNNFSSAVSSNILAVQCMRGSRGLEEASAEIICVDGEWQLSGAASNLSCVEANESKSSTTGGKGAIIGGVIGGVIGLIVLIIAGLYIRKKRFVRQSASLDAFGIEKQKQKQSRLRRQFSQEDVSDLGSAATAETGYSSPSIQEYAGNKIGKNNQGNCREFSLNSEGVHSKNSKQNRSQSIKVSQQRTVNSRHNSNSINLRNHSSKQILDPPNSTNTNKKNINNHPRPLRESSLSSPIRSLDPFELVQGDSIIREASQTGVTEFTSVSARPPNPLA